ncbi:MAG: hypothetical protein ABID09_04010, partial [Candidatus Omnitrophota bacterium]
VLVKQFRALIKNVRSMLAELGIESGDIPGNLSNDDILEAANKLIRRRSNESLLYLKVLKAPDSILQKIDENVKSLLADTSFYREATNRWVIEEAGIFEGIQESILAEEVMKNESLKERFQALSAGYKLTGKESFVEKRPFEGGETPVIPPWSSSAASGEAVKAGKTETYSAGGVSSEEGVMPASSTISAGVVMRLADPTFKARYAYRSASKEMFNAYVRAAKSDQMIEAERAQIDKKLIESELEEAKIRLRLAIELKNLRDRQYDDESVRIDAGEKDLEAHNNAIKAQNDVEDLTRKLTMIQLKDVTRKESLAYEIDPSAEIDKLMKTLEIMDRVVDIAASGEPYDISLTGEKNVQNKSWWIGLQLPLPIWFTSKWAAKKINVKQAKEDQQLELAKAANVVIGWINEDLKNTKDVASAKENVKGWEKRIEKVTMELGRLKEKNSRKDIILRAEMDIARDRMALRNAQGILKKAELAKERSGNILAALERSLKTTDDLLMESPSVTGLKEFAAKILSQSREGGKIRLTWEKFKETAEKNAIAIKIADTEKEKSELELTKKKLTARLPHLYLVALYGGTGAENGAFRYGLTAYTDPSRWFEITNPAMKEARLEDMIKQLDGDKERLNVRLNIDGIYGAYRVALVKAESLKSLLQKMAEQRSRMEAFARVNPETGDEAVNRYDALIADTEKMLRDTTAQIDGLKIDMMNTLQSVGDIDFVDDAGKSVELSQMEKTAVDFETLWPQIESGHPDIKALKIRIDKEEVSARAVLRDNWWTDLPVSLSNSEGFTPVLNVVLNVRLNPSYWENNAEKIRVKEVREELSKNLSVLRRRIDDLIS